ncbi:hypothetical protein HPB52_021703 [Rhipicephalus sanguineus]|uniref:Secreted protein n=1 Tax=Rhipicephalus sanguineus TaxID=34632 RepID=A0A9D4T349_RHISA|nr:hypothetical protein HPB52_021703 [Rhipicephalus sanguineus]
MALRAAVVVSVLLRAQRACFAHVASVALQGGLKAYLVARVLGINERGGLSSYAEARRGSREHLMLRVVVKGQSSHERKHKRFQVLETVAVMEDLRSQRPFGPLSGLKAYLCRQGSRNQVAKAWDIDIVIASRLKGSGSVNPTVSFHVVPRVEPRRSQWLNAVPMIRRQKKEP